MKCWWNGAYVRSSTSVPFAGGCPARRLRGHHDPGRAHLALDVAVLVEAPVDEVLVVGHGGVEGDDEPARPADLGAGLLVDVLPQDAVVLLVDADRVGDRRAARRGSRAGPRPGTDLAEAVAARAQRGGHEAQAPLADVERGPPVVVRAGVAVRHHHLGEREPVRDRPQPAAVAIADRVQDQALAVVEADPQLPVLPAQQVAVEGERDALGLG